jgi:Zn ribbon nucleic-acid-binding protein
MENTPVRLVTQDELRTGARRILARRQRAFVSSWGGFFAAVGATLVAPSGIMVYGILWLSATMITGFMVVDAQCPRCHSPFHMTLVRRNLRARQCLHCGFDLRRPDEHPPGPTLIERRSI